MTPAAVVLEPILKARPWGGAALARWGKALPADVLIGESWELSDLPGDESRVARGPLRGHTIRELMSEWGRHLLGDCAPVAGRFPLLVKLLDAADNLSVQVHPRPRDVIDQGSGVNSGSPYPAVKHECWFVLEALPGAVLYAGLLPGITAAELSDALGTARIVELLARREVRAGDCFYLPSGTLHALGAGILVAEVQTPSDVTYRAYDWERRDSAGRARELHLSESLDNVRWDVAESHILAAASAADPESARFAPITGATPLVRCPAFALDRWSGPIGAELDLRGEMAVLIGLAGRLALSSAAGGESLGGGETMLVPATCARQALRVVPDLSEKSAAGAAEQRGAVVLIARATA